MKVDFGFIGRIFSGFVWFNFEEKTRINEAKRKLGFESSRDLLIFGLNIVENLHEMSIKEATFFAKKKDDSFQEIDFGFHPENEETPVE